MTDQLSGIRRILDEIIAPELREGYPSQVLRGIVKNLAMLEGAWVKILPFLEWDNRATAELLAAATRLVGDDLGQRIDGSLEQGTPARSLEELEQRNADLRGLLTEVIAQLPESDHAAEVETRIKAHLVERTGRYPFRMAIAAPTSAKS